MMPGPLKPEDDPRSVAEQIAAKAANPAAVRDEAIIHPEPGPEPGPWAPEEWRGRYLVVRHVKLPNSPMVRREVHGTSKLGSNALVFESEESAQKCADKLNEEKEA